MILDTLLTELEEDLSTVDMRRRGDKARDMLRSWEAEHPDEEISQEVRWEIWALDMMVRPKNQDSEQPVERFHPLIEWSNGVKYPDVETLTADDRAIEHYRRRANETSNPIQRARYADFLWEALGRRKAPDAFRFGLMAGEAYIEVADLCLRQIEYIEFADALTRAAELARQLNNRNLAEKVVAAILATLNTLSGEDKYRWVLDLGDILISYTESRFADLVPTRTLEHIRDICCEGIAHHDGQQQRNLSILHGLMELCSTASQKIGDEESWWTWKMAIAESFKKEARQRETAEGPSGGSLVAFKFAENALHLYQQLASQASSDTDRQRLQAKVQELRREIRRLIRQAEREMKEISVSLEIPRDAPEQLVGPLLEIEPERVFESLSMIPSLLPDLDHLRQQAEEMAEKYIFVSLFATISLRDGRKIDEIPALEGESARFREQLDMWFQTHWQLLDFIFYRLKDTDRFTPEAFMAHVLRWELIDERHIPFLKVGLERYFAEDYVSAAHVLAPRVESILKAAFEQTGLPPMVVPNIRQIREQTLGAFLRREEVKQALGEPIWTYLDYTLVDEQGLNLRNDVAHGWIDFLDCSRSTVQILLFVILLLTRLSIVDRREEAVWSETADEAAADG